LFFIFYGKLPPLKPHRGQAGTSNVPFRFWRAHGGEQKQTHGKEVSLMRKYELVCVVQPDLDETAFNSVIDRLKGWISESGGNVDKMDIWGRRKLAYPIHKHRDGQYVLLNVSLNPSATAELERNLRFLEPVLRYMLSIVGE
jgi:small subunit ribosomal protein S6